MAFTSIVPAAPLGALVESIWDCDLAAPPHRFERILPTPGAALIINLLEDETRLYATDAGEGCRRQPGSIVSGPYTRSFVIDTAEQIRVMGVVFRPGGAWPFFGVPVDVLSDIDVGLEDLTGTSARSLREQLLHTACPVQRLACLERWLRRRAPEARPQPMVSWALDVLHRQPQVARIGALVAESGLSPRRFGALFREHVGLLPKRYARILRFRSVVEHSFGREHVEWARVAADRGFHDQPHLVREFHAFAGMTPSAYEAHRGPHINHLSLG